MMESVFLLDTGTAITAVLITTTGGTVTVGGTIENTIKENY
jgi:hypothetical protein